MAKIWADRVKETTATTGTGTITLAGAVAQHQAVSAGIGDGNTCDYCLLSGNGTDWETGLGTVGGGGTTLARSTIYASSNAGAAISLTGTSTVFVTTPAVHARGYAAAENPLAGASSSSFATKGILFSPLADMRVRGLYCQVDEINTASYKAGVYAVDGSFVITAIAAVSPSYSATATAAANRVFLFSSPGLLTAGATYVLAHTRTDATTTTSSGVYATSAGAAYLSPAPATRQNTAARLASTNPAVSETFGTVATGFNFGLIFAVN
jgi:hypothetical protein